MSLFGKVAVDERESCRLLSREACQATPLSRRHADCMHSQTEIELVRLLNVELLVSASMIDAVRTRMLANGLVTRVAGAGAGAATGEPDPPRPVRVLILGRALRAAMTGEFSWPA